MKCECESHPRACACFCVCKQSQSIVTAVAVFECVACVGRCHSRWVTSRATSRRPTSDGPELSVLTGSDLQHTSLRTRTRKRTGTLILFLLACGFNPPPSVAHLFHCIYFLPIYFATSLAFSFLRVCFDILSTTSWCTFIFLITLV